MSHFLITKYFNWADDAIIVMYDAKCHDLLTQLSTMLGGELP